MRKIITIVTITILLIACKNEKSNNQVTESKLTDKIANEVGKVFPEKVYGLDKNGNKKTEIPTFIIEGAKLYTTDRNTGEKAGLFLEKRGNKVYNYDNDADGTKPIFIYEGDKYWEIDKTTETKTNLIFERRGEYIYQMTKSGEVKSFIVE